MGKKTNKNNIEFIDSLLINDLTFADYLLRLRKVALSIFEWYNLPTSMDARYIEKCLYYFGQCAFLYDETFGYINTNCTYYGKLNLYELPTRLQCNAFEFRCIRRLYTGLPDIIIKDDEITEKEPDKLKSAILVMNDWECTPTQSTLELFAMRLYESERTADVNIKAQKTPVIVVIDERQRLFMENLISQYDGNKPFIYGDEDQLSESQLRTLKTDAPFVADKVMEYKKEIWNEALTFLGINNIMVDKKERLIQAEASSNNELINLNLQSYLAPRQQACEQFNKLFKRTYKEISKEEFEKNKDNTNYYEKDNKYFYDNRISVRVRSDLKNIIKQAQSVVNDFKEVEQLENIPVDEGVKEDG